MGKRREAGSSTVLVARRIYGMITVAIAGHRETVQAFGLTAGIVVVQLILWAVPAHAGTDNTFLNTWIGRSFAKDPGLVALILGAIAWTIRAQFAFLFAGIGVAAVASIWPDVINQVITGTF
jgi:hypothetical protein